MTQPIISVRGLGKRYVLGHTTGPNTLRDRLAQGFGGLFARGAGQTTEDFWALREVAFDVGEGEVVGIIGRNGAGKSTLLKILSQITEPTTGEVRIRGRVASLLEVGTGFHNELSGRENIYLNGAILGMRKAEIDRKFDEIVDFSGVERFLDTPVKRYSSGMTVRLAFAVAAHLEPEILLIDEVLAVGDVEFQNKCLGKMGDVARSGRTIIFVSHNMAAIENLCDRGILLNGGAILMDGTTGDVVRKYSETASEVSGDIDVRRHPSRVAGATPIVTRFQVLDLAGRANGLIAMGERASFAVHLATQGPVTGLKVGIHIYTLTGQRITTFHSGYQYAESVDLSGSAVLKFELEHCELMSGKYKVVLGVATDSGVSDRIDPVGDFEVLPRDVFGTGKLPPTRDGVFLSRGAWMLERSGP